uniref:Uncharacterized protein n=1 Tax=Trichinella nativa TaxID=6335 RepID=A0A0V1KJM2_9BILA
MFDWNPVNVDNDLRRDENENSVHIDFVNLDQTSGSLMPGGSLSAYLKHSTIWGKVSRQQSFQFQLKGLESSVVSDQ